MELRRRRSGPAIEDDIKASVHLQNLEVVSKPTRISLPFPDPDPVLQFALPKSHDVVTVGVLLRTPTCGTGQRTIEVRLHG